MYTANDKPLEMRYGSKLSGKDLVRGESSRLVSLFCRGHPLQRYDQENRTQNQSQPDEPSTNKLRHDAPPAFDQTLAINFDIILGIAEL